MTTTTKVLSLWQPWASLILLGNKQFETRSWGTKHRGKLAIHAAKKKGDPLQSQVIKTLKSKWDIEIDFDSLPFGKAIAICELVDCIEFDEDFARDHREAAESIKNPELEHDLGDWSYGRFVWHLKNVQAIEPFPLRGRQGLFNAAIDIWIKNPLPASYYNQYNPLGNNFFYD